MAEETNLTMDAEMMDDLFGDWTPEDGSEDAAPQAEDAGKPTADGQEEDASEGAQDAEKQADGRPSAEPGRREISPKRAVGARMRSILDNMARRREFRPLSARMRGMTTGRAEMEQRPGNQRLKRHFA